MRFDEFVAREHIEVRPADRFVGFSVGVELPPEWEQVDAKNGLRVWVWASDPRRKDFCGNAVLNLYRVQAVVEPSVLFAMLCEQQRQSVPNSRELLSDLAAATEGPGAAGTLVLQIDHVVGMIECATRSRIITVEHQTLVAELTVTALHDSPLDRSQIGLSVVVDHASLCSDSSPPG